MKYLATETNDVEWIVHNAAIFQMAPRKAIFRV